MSDLETIAARHNVPVDAAQHLLDALARGHGAAAQFSHPALGGMGQWSANGMTMVGDMFNTSLQARVASLCTDLVPLVSKHQGRGARPSAGGWWPADLGQPSSAGSQNDSHYAFFPDARRLAIKTGGRVTVYDTGDNRIGGVSQQQGSGSDLSFTSQRGPVHLHSLPVVNTPAGGGHTSGDGHTSASHTSAPHAPARNPRPRDTPEPLHAAASSLAKTSPSPGSNPAPHSGGSAHGASSSPHDVLTTLERLSDLRQKGVLTDEEFAAKKRELLSRL